MSFQLVIAEKPSVARSIATVIGADEKQNGYWQGDGYLVSWCIGHLVSFAEAGQYDEKYCKWKYEDLPILPQPWQFIVPDEKKQQFEVLRALLNRPDVDSVTAATDAGREGELIFRFVYQMAGCTKPVKRLWISSMEDAAIREGFANLRPDSDYDALYQSALCRAKADWLVGINATRLFSVLYHKTLTVGRVQTPTLKMLVDRDAKILRFQKEKYYTVGIQSGSLKADSGRIADAETANSLKEKCTGANAVCTSIRREKKAEQPPKLYDLTTLQREANRLFGFTAKQTLDYAQQLYEKRLLTYPRTDSQYLTEDMGQTAQHLVSDLLELLPFAQELDLTPEVGRILNSKKVSDHHAILPTAEFVKQGFTGLAESECKLMNLVCFKLLCAVAAPHEYETVTAVFSCAGNEFTAKGKTVLVPGWKEIDQRFRSTMKADGEEEAESLNTLPELAEGQSFRVTSTVSEHFTSPPKAYTEDTLLSAMERAGAEDMPEDKVNCSAGAREGGLGHLSQRLDEMELAIHKPSFRKGTGRANEVNYWVFDYPPEKELEVRERVEYLKNKNDRGDDDFELVVFDLYDIIIDFLEKKNFMEKCYDFEKKRGIERIVKAVTNSMKVNDDDSLIVQYIKEHTPENAVVFLTGIGKCYPILRSHKVLNNLHQAFVRCPVVMFFPGTYNEQELILFNEIKDDNYYRAFRLVK